MSISSDKDRLNDCGCCEDVALRYPGIANSPGRSAIDYRVATHSGFLRRMLATLTRDQLTGESTNEKRRPLQKLTTRSTDDPAIALFDAWATTMDVLTFYQERIANEGYIRTATERRSVLELARAIGYELNPGVAASTYLAFTVENMPGMPETIRIPEGNRVLSLPKQDKLPQTFETVEEIIARPEWNALKLYTPVDETSDPLTEESTQVRLKGLGTGLRPGDVVAIASGAENKVCRLQTVTTDSGNGYTLITWETGLGNDYSTPTLYAFRLRASLFGHNAADWQSLDASVRDAYVRNAVDAVTNVAASPDGKKIAAATQDGKLKLWIYESNKWAEETVSAEISFDAATCVAVSDDVGKILVGYSDGSLKLWIETNGSWGYETLPGSSGRAHSASVEGVAFSTDGTKALSRAGDTSKLWDLAAGGTYTAVTFTTALSVVSGSTTYRVSSDDWTLKRWTSLSATPEIVSTEAHDAALTSMSLFSASQILSGGADGTLKLWNRSNNQWTGTLIPSAAGPAHTAPVIKVAFSSDGLKVLSRAESTTTIWDPADGEESVSFTEDTLDYLTDWPNFGISSDQDQAVVLDLDAVYPSVVSGSRVALVSGTETGLYQVTQAELVWRTDYGLSSRITRLTLAGAGTGDFDPRTTTVFAQSEPLELYAEEVEQKPPVEGKKLEVATLEPQLETGRSLVVSGKRMRARVKNAQGLSLLSADEFSHADPNIAVGDELVVLSPPKPDSGYVLKWRAEADEFIAVLEQSPSATTATNTDTSNIKWHLRDRNGFEGYVETPVPVSGNLEDTYIRLAPPLEDDETTSEVVFIEERDESEDRKRTQLVFTAALQNIYGHDSVTINANVARATHGETVAREILGSGDGTLTNQQFMLKKNLLTHVSAPTASGGESTLEVRVNDVLWSESSSLYGLGTRDQNYIVRRDNDHYSTIIFGDGKNGARLPSGQNNIAARYRSGIGSDGEVEAQSLILLQDKPLGIRSVTNPVAASGAAEPETLDGARANAPLTVLTLDRIISIKDFEDFAAAFAGIGKAQAVSLWNGEVNFAHITLGAANGDPVEPTSDLYVNLVEALSRVRDTSVQVRVDTFASCHFNVEAEVLIDERYQWETVETAIKNSLKTEFSFSKRGFGQQVTKAEVITAIQKIEGVLAVNVTALYDNLEELAPNDPLPLNDPLPKERMTARWVDGEVQLAQLWLVNPGDNGIELKEMSS